MGSERPDCQACGAPYGYPPAGPCPGHPVGSVPLTPEEREERKRLFVSTPNPDGPRRWLIEGTDWTTIVFQPRDQPFGRGEVVEVVEVVRAGEGELRGLLGRLYAAADEVYDSRNNYPSDLGNRSDERTRDEEFDALGRVLFEVEAALSAQRAGEPTPEEVERLRAAHRDLTEDFDQTATERDEEREAARRAEGALGQALADFEAIRRNDATPATPRYPVRSYPADWELPSVTADRAMKRTRAALDARQPKGER